MPGQTTVHHTPSGPTSYLEGLARSPQVSSLSLSNPSPPLSRTGSQPPPQQQQQLPSATADKCAARPKRTRGPRSCLECRSSKQRCEQFDVAAIVPSNKPQPPELTCRRCRVLQLPCIVPNELPKSTRMRIERGRRSEAAAVPTSGESSAAGYDDDLKGVDTQQAQGGTSSSSVIPVRGTESSLTSSPSSSRFDLQVFDPLPILQPSGPQLSRHGSHGSPNSPADKTGGLPRSGHSSYIKVPSGSHQLRAMSPSGLGVRLHSACSESAAISSQRGPSEWLHRAKTATQPIALVEHLSAREGDAIAGSSNGSTHVGTGHQTSPGTAALAHSGDWSAARLSTLPRLEAIVAQLLSDKATLRRVTRRFANLQMVVSFLPDIERLIGAGGEHASFLLAVALCLEGFLSQEHTSTLRAHIAIRCVMAIDDPPTDVRSICALVLVALYCPRLVPSHTSHYQMSGGALLASCLHAASQMGLSSALGQLRSYLDGPESQLPYVEGQLVQGGALYVFLEQQIALLELLGEDTRRLPYIWASPQPSTSPSRSSSRSQNRASLPSLLSSSSATDLDTLERYCKIMIELNAPERERDDLAPSARAALFQRCAAHLMTVMRARETRNHARTIHDYLTQLTEQSAIWRGAEDAPSATHALRRWIDQALSALTTVSTDTTRELQRMVAFIGTHHACEPAFLALLELELSSLETLSIARLKDRLYDAGIAIVGQCQTSQEFLFRLFAMPSLCKVYELSGQFRSFSARHALLLFSGLVMDLRTGEAQSVAPLGGFPKDLGTQSTPLAPWRIIADVLTVPRWCGIIITCATSMLEEIAGRFLAQEPPMGSLKESRFEITSLLLVHLAVILRDIDQDARLRYHAAERSSQLQNGDRWNPATGADPYSTGAEKQIAPAREELGVVSVTLEALRAMNASIAKWRKESTGIARYQVIRASPADRSNSLEELAPLAETDTRRRASQVPSSAASQSKSSVSKPEASVLHPTNGSRPPVHVQETGSSAMPAAQDASLFHTSNGGSNYRGTEGNLPYAHLGQNVVKGSTHQHSAAFSVNGMLHDPRNAGATAGYSHPLPGFAGDQPAFGDALLADILFTPIESFFGMPR